MDMRVDQAGQQSGVAKIDNLRARPDGSIECPTSAMRSPCTKISPGAVILPVSTSSKRAAWSTTVGLGLRRREAAAMIGTAEGESFISVSPFGARRFQHLFHFRLVSLQERFIGGLEAHNKHRLRVGSPQQSPAFRKNDADAVDIDGRVCLLEVLRYPRHQFELDFVGTIDANFGRGYHLGNPGQLRRERTPGFRNDFDKRQAE